MAKFGPLPDPHPPKPEIVSEFLACGEWRDLEGLLTLLRCDRKRPEISYAWFVTVAMEKLWEIPPEALREARRRLRMRVVTGGKNATAQQPQQQTAARHEATAVAPAPTPAEREAMAKALAVRQKIVDEERASAARAKGAIRAVAVGKAMR